MRCKLKLFSLPQPATWGRPCSSTNWGQRGLQEAMLNFQGDVVHTAWEHPGHWCDDIIYKWPQRAQEHHYNLLTLKPDRRKYLGLCEIGLERDVTAGKNKKWLISAHLAQPQQRYKKKIGTTWIDGLVLFWWWADSCNILVCLLWGAVERGVRSEGGSSVQTITVNAVSCRWQMMKMSTCHLVTTKIM